MFAEADLAQPVVQVVEHEHGSRQNKAGVGVLLGQAVFQLLVEEARHAVAEIAVQGAGDGRQRDALGFFEVQAAHERTQAFREGHPVERGKGAQAVVVGVEGQQPAPAGGLKPESRRPECCSVPTARRPPRFPAECRDARGTYRGRD